MHSEPPSGRPPPLAGGSPWRIPLAVDVSTLPVSAVTVDVLARLQLAARRSGRSIVLRNASAELLDLVAFMGLADVLPP